MCFEFFIIKRRILRLIKNRFKASDLVLDIGCGERPYYHESIKAKIVCADIKHTKKAHLVCDGSLLPIKSSRFDGLVCVNSLYYHKNPFDSVKEFSKVLKKSGKLLIIMPFMYPIHDAPDDKYRFTKYGIIELLKNDFSIKEIRTIGGIFNLPAVFFHSIIKGMRLIKKVYLKPLVVLLTIILYPFYIISQVISLLDFLDITGRWATYYFVVAEKK